MAAATGGSRGLLMKLFGVLYLVFVFTTTTLGAYLAWDATCMIFSIPRESTHPLVADALHCGLFGLIFLQGLAAHLRLTGIGVVILGVLGLEGIILLALHLLK